MVSIEEFKKALGSLADNMTDEQIRAANERMSQLAGALFVGWAKTLKATVDQDPQLLVK